MKVSSVLNQSCQLQCHSIDLKFGNAVKSLRKKETISQEQLAHLAKIDRTHMGHIERGNVSPSLKTMSQIALALNITLGRLLSNLQQRDLS